MRYSVCAGGRMPLTYYSPEMTGFYNRFSLMGSASLTIALPETAGL